MNGLIDTMDSLIEGPTREPLDLDEVKKHLRFGSTTEDTLLDSWISAARQYIEEQTGRQIMTATWELWLTGSPAVGVIELPHPPLQSVISVAYDADGEQTFDAAGYQTAAPAGPFCSRGRVSLLSGSAWPTFTSATQPNALRIRYTAGYGSTPGDVPDLIKSAMYLLIGHFHRNRSEVQDGNTLFMELPLGAAQIIRALKYSALPTLPHRSSYGSLSCL